MGVLATLVGKQLDMKDVLWWRRPLIVFTTSLLFNHMLIY